MASSYRIKGITVEIGGDTTNLYKSLREVNDEIKETQKELKDVERLLKLDPTNVELLAQKQKLLAQAVEETAEKEKTLEEAAKQANEQFKAGKIDEKQFNALKVELEGARKEAENARRAYKEFNPELERTAELAGKAAEATKKAADATKGISTTAGAIAGALIGSAVKASQYADELLTTAQQSGFSPETLQRWEYASELVDVSVENIIGAARKLKKNMASTSEEVVAAWDKLGIAAKNVYTGEFRNFEEVFNDVLKALSRIPDETERDIIAMTLFGKSADDLAGIIDDGGAGLKYYGDEAASLGLILGDEALQGANEFSDGLYRIKERAEKTFVAFGAALAEQLLPELDKLVDKLSGVFEWVLNLSAEKVISILNITLILAILSPLLTVLSKIIEFVKLGIIYIPKLAAALSLTVPKLLIIVGALAALVGSIVAIVQNWDKMNDFERVISILGALTVAALGAAVAMGAFHSAWSVGLAAAGIVAGIAAVVAAVESAKARAGDTSSLGFDVHSITSGITSSGAEFNMTSIPSEAYSTDWGPNNSAGNPNVMQRNATVYYANGGSDTVVNIKFGGDLAGLARVLEPAITIEKARQGIPATAGEAR